MSRFLKPFRAAKTETREASPQPAEPAVPTSVDEIPGWFRWLDQRVFEHFLGPDAVEPDGDLVELGVYMGKSAALIGGFQKPGETFTVCDLFGASPDDAFNSRENQLSYKTLDLESFTRNYLALHEELPVIVQNLSSTITEHVPPASARFIHVDASHLYEHVAIDIRSARQLLRPGGVIAFDDYRSEHTPGVAAAVWEAVFTFGLIPICVTPMKLYASFDEAGPHLERLDAWLEGQGRIRREAQMINGREVRRMSVPRKVKK